VSSLPCRGRGSRSSWGRSITRGPAVLTLMCAQADLIRCAMCKVLRAVESPLRGYNDLQGGFEELWSIGGWGLAEESGLLASYWQWCVETLRGPIDRCLPLSNPMSARLCLLLRSPDLIVSTNKRVFTRSVKAEEPQRGLQCSLRLPTYGCSYQRAPAARRFPPFRLVSQGLSEHDPGL
jgi:hypothetical protein